MRAYMLDAYLRRVIDPPLTAAGHGLARFGISADGMTLLGLAFGLGAAFLITQGALIWALGLIILSRLADGLDGAIARASRKTDFGGYLDITCDFLFYGAVPMAFIWLSPEAHAMAGAWLLTSFYFNGATFLGYAILAEKRGMETSKRGAKSLYFTGGLLEGTETIALFCLFCLLPEYFAPLAWGFGALCFVTAASRLLLARQVFQDTEDT